MPAKCARRYWKLLFFILALGAGSCEYPPAPVTNTFADGFKVVAGGGGSDSFQRHTRVTRNGRQEDAMVLVAPITVRAPLHAPDGKSVLRLLATPVFNIGDGMNLDVFVESNGDRTKVFSRYFDAGRKVEDRAWVPLEIPLDRGGVANPHLEFAVSGGPQGDLVADWLALAELQIAPR